MTTSLVEAAAAKPLLRGVSHQIFAVVVAVASGFFVHAAIGSTMRVACAVYAASLGILFGVSALYHRPQWGPSARQWMRRLDHSAIFVLIAGCYTPFCVMLPPASGRPLLALAWACCALGVLRALFWVNAPKPIVAVLAAAMGWMVLAYLPVLLATIGLRPLLWLGAGGLTYTLGAVVYALKRPNPLPRVFGYHEVFHGLVIVAALLQFKAIVLALQATGHM